LPCRGAAFFEISDFSEFRHRRRLDVRQAKPYRLDASPTKVARFDPRRRSA